MEAAISRTMDILQQIDNPIDLLDDNLSQGPIALRDSLARQCATVANAVLEEGTRAGNAKMALAWAQQALDYGESTGLAEMCKAKALEALGHWNAAAESFRTLRGNNRVAREKERTLKKKIKKLEEGGPHPTTGKSLLSKARVATFNGEINGGSPKKILNRVTEGDTAIRDSQPSTPAQKQTRELFLHVFDPPTIEGNILLRTLWARSGKAIRVASWNAQLMNKVDGPSDARIDDAIKWKAASIGRVVKSDTVSLLVIQEAPGPQLRTSGGKISKQIAEENKFTSALKTHLPEGFEFAQVALSNIKNDREMGEDHIYGWDPSAMTKLDQLTRNEAYLEARAELTGGRRGDQEDLRSREGLKRPGQLPGHSLHRRPRRPRAAPRNSNKISRLPAARSAAATSPAARSARAPWEAPGPWRRWTSPHRPRSHQALAAPERPFHHPFASCATRTLPPCNSIGGGW